MERARLVTLILLLIALIFLIAGGIMLGIGIHKAKQKKEECDKCKSQSNCTIPSNSGYVLHFSIDPGLSWNDTYNDLNSPDTQSIINDLSTNVTNLLTTQSFSSRDFPQLLYHSGFALTAPLYGVSPDYLLQSLNRTTVFYGTIVFGGPVDPVDVQSALIISGWIVSVQSSSYPFCQGLCNRPTPPPPPVGDFPCDPRTPPRTVIVMIDVALPMDPQVTKDDKLKAIQDYVTSLSPPLDLDWGDLQMGIGIFYGSNAYLINNWLCSNRTCWDNAIAQIAINVTSQSHNITRAFEFIRDEFSSIDLQLKPGRARSLTILADGFEYDNGFGVNRSIVLSEVVSYSFYTSTILVSNSRSVRSTYAQIVPSGYRFVNVDHWYQLGLDDIRSRSLSWICLAPILTTPSPTLSTPTWKPINATTTPLARPTQPTTPTGPPPLPEKCNGLQVLFLIDMSQSITGGFQNITSFIKFYVEQTQMADQAEYAYISFNAQPHDTSGGFMGVDDFLAYLNTTRYVNGYTNYTIGFNETAQFFDNFDQTRPGAVVFITPGNANDMDQGANIEQVQNVVRKYRGVGFQMIGLLVIPNDEKRSLLNNILMIGQSMNGEANLIETADYNSLVSTAPQASRILTCRETNAKVCNLDTVFLVEDSEVVGDVGGQFYARGAILAYINKTRDLIGKFEDRIALAYYSNPYDFPFTMANRTAIAFNFTQDISYNPDLLEEQIRLTIPEYPYGSYSDISLGLSLARQLLGGSPTQNGQLVIIFGRGEFTQPDQNCCDDPSNISTAMLSTGILMKGAVIGSDRSESIMQQITGQPNFQVPEMNPNNAEELGAQLVDQMLQFRKQAAIQSNCLDPEIENFCQDPQDIILIIHMPRQDDEALFYIVKNFTVNALLQAFGGLDYGGVEKLTRVAIFTYFGENVTQIQTLPASFNLSTAIDAVESIQFIPHDFEICNLSLAYDASLDQFERFGRSYASWSTIVIAENLDEEDSEAAINASLILNQKGIFNFGIGTSDNETNFPGIDEIWQKYTLIDGNILEPTDGAPSVYTSNEIRDYVCDHYPGEGIPTDPPSPPPSPTIPPGFLPQGNLAAQTWPDITILYDTSADFTPNNTALNDKGFEVLRMFLINTFIKYQIGDLWTRVALVTFDGQPKTVFNLSRHSDWSSLYQSLTEDFQYGPSNSHDSQKNIDDAVSHLIDNIYQPKYGFRTSKTNYLWIITTGSQNLGTNQNRYEALLSRLSGVNVIGIGLGDGVDEMFMKTLASTYVISRNYTDPQEGMASQMDLIGPLLYQITTNRKDEPPAIRRINGDVVLAIDREMIQDTLNDLKDYLKSFLQNWRIESQYTQVAIVPFDSNNVNNPKNFDTNLANINNNIQSIPAKGDNNLGKANYQNAIDYILNTISNPLNGKRSDVPGFIFFFTQSIDNSIGDQTNLNQLKEKYSIQILCLNNQSIPDFANTLASQDQYAYLVPDIKNWAFPINGDISPIQSFFMDFRLANLDYLRENDLTSRDVYADITLIYDFANLDDNSYSQILDYLKSFVTKYSIDLFDAQFSGLCFADEILYEFPFSSCIDTSTCIQQMLDQWKFKSASNSSLLVNVLDRVANIQYSPQNGWRQSKSYVLIFSAQNSTTWDGNDMRSVRSLLQTKNSFTYYVDMSNGRDLPIQYKQYFDSYDHFQNTTDLQNNQTDYMIQSTVSTNYQGYKYPPALDLRLVVADFVFVIDTSLPTIFNRVRNLIEYLISQLTISNSYVRVSLLTYNGNGIVQNMTFPLNFYSNIQSLNSTIESFNELNPTESTDLGSALAYLDSSILNQFNGFRGNQTFITFFNSNPKLTSSLDNYLDSIQRLQSRSFISFYGFDMASSDPDDNVYLSLRRIIPTVMSATQIVRTLTVEPGSSVIDGGNGYIAYIRNVYGSYVNQPTPPTISPQSTLIPTLPTTTSSPDLSNSFPLDRLKTDLLWIIDPNIFTTTSTYDYVRDCLIEYSDEYLISPDYGSQWAILYFDSVSGIAYNSFDFTASTDQDALISLLSQDAPSFQLRSNFDLSSSLTRASSQYFSQSGGYRGGSSAVVIITSNTTLKDSCSQLTVAASRFPPGTLLFGLSLSGNLNSLSLQCLTNQFTSSDQPMQLRVDDLAMKRLSRAISDSFEQNIPIPSTDLPVNPIDTKMDVIFVLDVLEMTDQDFDDTKSFIRRFVSSYPIMNDTTGIQFAVITYSNSPKTDVTKTYDSFTFLQSSSLNQLQLTIDGLSKSTDSMNLDLENLFKTVISTTLDPDFGHWPYKPTAIIVLGSRKDWSGSEYIAKYRGEFPIFSIDVTGNGAMNWLSYLSDPEYIYRSMRDSISFQRSLDGDSTLIQRIQSFLSLAYMNSIFNRPLPSKLISVDVIFVIDSSNALNDHIKSNLISSLISLMTRYDPSFTRFSFLFYGSLSYSKIYLNSYKSLDALYPLINQTIQSLNNTNDQTFDINGALLQASTDLLLNENGFRGGALVVNTIVFTSAINCPVNTSFFPSQTIFFAMKNNQYSDWLSCISTSSEDISIIQNGLFQDDFQTGRLVSTISRAARYTVDDTPLNGNPLNNAKPKDVYIVTDLSYFSRNIDISILLTSYFVDNFWRGYDTTQARMYIDSSDNQGLYSDINTFIQDVEIRTAPNSRYYINFDLNGILKNLLQNVIPMGRDGVPQVIIIIITSPKFTRIDDTVINTIRAKTSVFGISMIQNPDHLSEILKLTSGNLLNYYQPIYTAKTFNYDALGELFGEFVARLTNIQSFPTNQIQADYIFIIDGTTEMTSSYNKSLDVISRFSSYLSIMEGEGRIGVLTYGDNATLQSFSPSYPQDYFQLQNFLQIQSPARQVSLFWDISGAIDYAFNHYYDNSRITFVYIMAANNNTGSDCLSLGQIKIEPNSRLRGISFGSLMTSDSLRCLIGSELDTVIQYPLSPSISSPPFSILSEDYLFNFIHRFLQKDANVYRSYMESISPISPIPISETYQSIVIYYEQSIWIDEPTFNIMKDFMILLYRSLPSTYVEARLSICPLILNLSCIDILSDLSFSQFNYTASMETIITFNCGNSTNCESLKKVHIGPSATSIFLTASPSVTSLSDDFIRTVKGQGNVLAIDLLGIGASTAYLNQIVTKSNYLRQLGYGQPIDNNQIQWVVEAITTDYSSSIDLIKSLSKTENDVILILDASSVVDQDFYQNTLIPSAIYLINSYSSDDVHFAVFISYNDSFNPSFDFNTINLTGSLSDSTYYGSNKDIFDPNSAVTQAISILLNDAAGFHGEAYTFIYFTSNPDENYTDCNCEYYYQSAVFYFSSNAPLWTRCMTSGETISPFNPSLLSSTTMATTTQSSPDHSFSHIMDITLGRATYEYFLSLRNRPLVSNLSGYPLDLIVVIDSNNLLSSSFTKSMINYISQLINLFKDDQYGSLRLGLVFAAPEPIIQFYLSETDDLNQILLNLENTTRPDVFIDSRTNLKLTMDFVQNNMLSEDKGRRYGVPAIVLLMLQNENIISSDRMNDTDIDNLRREANIFGLNIYGGLRTADTLLSLTKRHVDAYDVIWDEYYLSNVIEKKSLVQVTNFIWNLLKDWTYPSSGSPQSTTSTPTFLSSQSSQSSSISPSTTDPS